MGGSLSMDNPGSVTRGDPAHLNGPTLFDHTGSVDLGDLSFLASNYGLARGGAVDVVFPESFLQRWVGAGLDVFETEPLPSGHPLTTLPNVLLTPHTAGMTPEVIQIGLAMAVENIENFLKGKPTHVVAPT